VTADLLAPFQLGPNRLANRVVMAPMTRNRAGADDAPHALNALYYAQRASAGLILTEGTQITPQGKGYPGTAGIHSAAQIAGWTLVTDAVHAKGGKIFLQLWHVGRVTHPALLPAGMTPVAPSAMAPHGAVNIGTGKVPYVTPHPLIAEEIRGIVQDYAQAARNALAANFDGVEIHAANGYLIDQFLRDGTNRRTDEYGGSLANRARFLLEIARAVSAVWGPGRVGVRLSPVNAFNDISDSDPQRSFEYFAAALGGLDLAYLHAVETHNLPFDWAALRRRYKGVYIANGGYDLAKARAAIDRGDADLVSFGVLYLANPDVVERFRHSAPFNAPIRATYYGGDARGYTDYPFWAETAVTGHA
jgi:N-ethylmaleimide reductase